MYKVEKVSFGYKLTLSGFIKSEEMQMWVKTCKEKVLTTSEEFHILVDMRELKPLPPESKPIMDAGQKFLKQTGVVRSVVILNSAVVSMQFKQLAKASGVYEFERYIDASSIPNWEDVGKKWLTEGIDPDQ